MGSFSKCSARWLVIAIFLIELSFNTVGSFSQGGVNSMPGNQDDPLWVKFCDLVKNPSKYDQKVIATDAIEVSYTVPALDGTDSFLYHPECNAFKSFVLLVSGTPIDPNSGPLKLKREIVSGASKKKQRARIRELIVGRFRVAKWPETGFGHLSWARFKLEVTGLERVEDVPNKVPWPDTFRTEK
jgi:hypothetical protein